MSPKKKNEEKKKIATKLVVILPYPQVKKKDINDKKLQKYLEMFIKFEINIPFFEAFEKMPMYQQFMKDIISKKEDLLR